MQLEAKVKEHELMETMLRNQVKELEVARASDQQEKLAMQRSLSESMTKASAPVDEATVLLGTMQEQVRSGVERDHTLEDKVRRLQNDLIEAKESAVDMELENEGLKQRVTSLEQVSHRLCTGLGFAMGAFGRVWGRGLGCALPVRWMVHWSMHWVVH